MCNVEIAFQLANCLPLNGANLSICYSVPGQLEFDMTTSARTSTRPDLIAILENNGFRVTGPRIEIIKCLEKRPDGFTAEEVAESLPQVSRATVFRTLKLLLGANVLCRLALPGGTPRYSLSREAHHHHTVCVNCGKVGEFRASTMERLLRAIGSEIPGEIVGHNIEFHILCNTCGP